MSIVVLPQCGQPLVAHPVQEQQVIVESAMQGPLVVYPVQEQQVIVESAMQGPPGKQGIPGPAGGAAFIRTAAATLSALVVVWEDAAGLVRPLDYRDEEHAALLCGLTITSADAGQDVTVQRIGPLDAAGLGLVPGRVWLGVDGRLTQNPPQDGCDILVGNATADERIYLNFNEAIYLED